MRNIYLSLYLILIGSLLGNFEVKGQESTFVYGDALPDAPELALRGDLTVGVRTLEFVNKDQLDINNIQGGTPLIYDRTMVVEVWYPAKSTEVDSLTIYDDVLGVPGNPNRPVVPFSFSGRASRDAEPDLADGPYPLLIVSHGYLGSRFLMTYLTENLASKGYVVVAIDHPESTHRNPGKFSSTLYYRALDDLFVLNQMAALGMQGTDSFLSGLVNADITALIGYSMGGYGVLNAAGAGYSSQTMQMFGQLTGGSKVIESRVSGNAAYQTSMDERIKAIVALAPWGMQRGAWDAEGLKGIRIPTFIVAGDQDDVSGYEDGVKAIYEGISNAEKYMLVYQNARHNVAPNPPPSASYAPDLDLNEYYHYAEPVWDQRRINNINQHFLTAFLGIKLKGLDYGSFLDLTKESTEESWKGFKPRTSIGLQLWRGEPEND
ncbi:alpha/beta hydrolase family protein [Lunatibacter salilacus]|uniref:alpha/beta hydrolase family protein n=1 Tax=Lunatibacter salilacus TaxID=2483804 RepID=UPI00131DCB9E|nr:dienelactone hydrolase [Lunatibacter salilacus]